MIDLTGKRALVTGGSRGIGRACVRLLAEAGADVVIGYHRNHEAAREAAAPVEALGRRALCLAADLGDADAASDFFKKIDEAFGGLDIVVVNAGLWLRAPIDEMTPQQWQQTMTANLDTTYHACHHGARMLKEAGGGKLILIASTAGQRGEAFYSHYAASKGAMIAMTRSLGSELGPHNINVNCVAPGWVLTDMTTDVFADTAFRERVCADIPLRRIAAPEDIAGPVLFLASELSRHLQGSVLSVNGGSVLA